MSVELNSANAPAPTNNGQATTTGTTVFGVEEIKKLLPHRYPFLLVDKIIEYTPGQKAVGIKNVTCNEPYFQGHFPERAVMPGVLIVEALAQVGGIVLSQLPEVDSGLCMLAGIDKCRFRRPVIPGDRLVMVVELLFVKRRRFGKMQAVAKVDDLLVAEGELTFSVVD